MRKLFSILLAICLSMAALCVTALAETAEDILTAEPWKSVSGAKLTLNADGTGSLVSNSEFNGEWTYAEPNLTFTYELYGTRTIDLILEQEDGAWKLRTEDGEGLYLPESQADAAAAEANADLEAYEIPLGTPITLPFATITFDHAEITGMVGSNETHHSYNTAAEGTRFMALQGTITNETNIELKVQQVRVEFVFDNNYTYSGLVKADVLLDGGKSGALTPLTTCDYTLYTTIPENLTASFKTCRVTYALNDNFATTPNYLADGDFVFVTNLDEEACAAAQQGPVRELTYFEECPILPEPTSFADFRQSSHNTSKSNGKLTKISYTYRALLDGDAISNLRAQYLDALRENGFVVAENGGEYTVSAGSVLLATITMDGDSMSMSLQPGNEGLTAQATEDGSVVVEADETEEALYYLGDTIRAHGAEMTMRDVSTTDKIYSDLNGTSDWYHYQESTSGDPLLAVFGEFKNTGTEPVDIYNIYAAFIIDGSYSYSAEVTGVKAGSSNFIRDVGPMQSTQCYVFGEVPESVVRGASSIVLKLGFTDDFGIKFTTSGSLPLFDRCDEVFAIELLGRPAAPTDQQPVAPTEQQTQTPVEVSASYETLEVGSRGDAVVKLQRYLISQGYLSGSADGIYGNGTAGGVKKFQAAEGLAETGIADSETQAKLFAHKLPEEAVVIVPGRIEKVADKNYSLYIQFRNEGDETIDRIDFFVYPYNASGSHLYDYYDSPNDEDVFDVLIGPGETSEDTWYYDVEGYRGDIAYIEAVIYRYHTVSGRTVNIPSDQRVWARIG